MAGCNASCLADGSAVELVDWSAAPTPSLQVTYYNACFFSLMWMYSDSRPISTDANKVHTQDFQVRNTRIAFWKHLCEEMLHRRVKNDVASRMCCQVRRPVQHLFGHFHVRSRDVA